MDVGGVVEAGLWPRELDGDVVGPAAQLQLGVVSGVGLAGPVMAEQHPFALAAAECHPPVALLGALDAGVLTVRCRRPGGEAVPAGVLDEQHTAELHREPLVAAQVAVVAVREREAVAELGVAARNAWRRLDRRDHRRQRGVGAVAWLAEDFQRPRRLGPDGRPAVGRVPGVKAGAAQAQQRCERPAGGDRPGDGGGSARRLVAFPGG